MASNGATAKCAPLSVREPPQLSALCSKGRWAGLDSEAAMGNAGLRPELDRRGGAGSKNWQSLWIQLHQGTDCLSGAQ